MNFKIEEAKRKEVAAHLRAAADKAEAGDVTGMANSVLDGLRVVAAAADIYTKSLGLNVKFILRGVLQRGLDSVFRE